MAYETRNNTGSVFPNDRKEKDSHPDHKGKALIDGQWFWVSAWEKSGSKGGFLSLSFELMTEEQVAKYGGAGGGQQQQRPQQQQRGYPKRGDDDCPGSTDVQRTPKPPRQQQPRFQQADVPF